MSASMRKNLGLTRCRAGQTRLFKPEPLHPDPHQMGVWHFDRKRHVGLGGFNPARPAGLIKCVGALIEDQETGVNAMGDRRPAGLAAAMLTFTAWVHHPAGFQQSDVLSDRNQLRCQSGILSQRDSHTLCSQRRRAACNSCGRPEDKMLRSAREQGREGEEKHPGIANQPNRPVQTSQQ
jgi:hypothetical protein